MINIRIVIFLLLSNYCVAQDVNFNLGNSKELNYYSEIPFEYVNGKIIVSVLINENKYRFLLDTGAPNLITKRLSTILNLESLQELKISDANQIKSTMNIVQLPNLTIGSIIFENSVALSSQDENNLVFDCFEIDGFIGSNLLRNSIIQIDVKNKILIITNDLKKLHLNNENSSKLSLFGQQSSPFIWLKLTGSKDSGKEQVLLDTGMKGFYDISHKNYIKFKDEKIFSEVANGKGSESIGLSGNSPESEQVRLLLKHMKIANSAFLNISTTTTNDNNSRIGIGLFENGIGTIDFINKKFYFEQYEHNKDLIEKYLPFSRTIINNKLSIGIVWDEKLKAKINYGDEIIEINGKNYENYKLCDFINKSIFENITVSEIKIRNKKGEINIITL
ncbi:Aspartyl protease [Flavobacterium omnivorum]|uniref:Aspartyl protease n=1 Tax=Flavobacterium omnivorum TaxID=178355 RepID=A0A1G8GZG3_9FLAO|nr:retropepsin-like aspartic protease [Flavobacterium omnivorum]SDH99783.1 Aspartyl protease [Flavobacterium omnivorum]